MKLEDSPAGSLARRNVHSSPCEHCDCDKCGKEARNTGTLDKHMKELGNWFCSFRVSRNPDIDMHQLVCILKK